MMRARTWILGTLAQITVLAGSTCAQAKADTPLILRQPTMNATHIVFSYAGDLWSVPRAGGDAVRLTSAPGEETDAHFSPDGKSIAFSGNYDGNVDVYVIPATGGIPKRITYHPGRDNCVGWTPDGKRVLFRSGRYNYAAFYRLYSAGLEGGMPQELPLPTASEGSLSPDGSRLAYVPIIQWQDAWKRYRGGQTKPIWIATLADSSVEKLPRQNSNDYNPTWVGNRIFFLSDRNGPVTLFSYDVAARRVKEEVKNTGLDLKAASAGPGGIVYEQFGKIFVFDTKAGRAAPIPIRIAADLPGARPRLVRAARWIRAGRISPTGARAIFQVRGDIVSVPAEKGDPRDITNTPGVAERDPAWSPDGSKIAYFSDESGEYTLHIRSQNGMGEVRKINLGASPSFFYAPTWSPDGKKIAYADKRLTLWYVNVEGGAPVKVDSDYYESFQGPVVPAWSPDSRWLTYSKMLKSHLGAVMLYSLESRKATQVTDGLSDARYPAFDRSGKYLYFTASTDLGLNIGNGDMTSMQRPMSRSVYLAVLNKRDPSPLLPESDEEKAKPEPGKEPASADAKPAEGTKPAESGKSPEAARKPVLVKPMQVDLDRIGQRIVAVPVPAHNYADLRAAKDGVIFLAELPVVALDRGGEPAVTLHRFTLSSRKFEKVLDGVQSFDISQNGEKLLYQQGQTWAIASTSGPIAPGSGTLKTAAVEVWVDPRAEWKQMYREVWRIERDFLYDPGLHGLDLPATERLYAAWLDGISSREDLNYLFTEMLGEITIGHMFVGGGDLAQPPRTPGGLLGADWSIENGRYRFARVYDGENWNPRTRAPLTSPGVNVQTGEYLLAVNGREVTPALEVYAYFEGTAGRQTVIKVGPNPNGENSREVTVVPLASEQDLRHLAWIEDNRRTVDRLSGGRLAYVYLPDTGEGGYTSFNRYFFAQTDKQGAVIDERYNGGGLLADYVVELLQRTPYNGITTRDGADEIHPVGAIFGPKAMLINEMAGSGGDWLPWTFKRRNVGPLVGKRTWGGLVGIGGYPELMDGGSVMAPRWALYGLNGSWEVENVGVAPDVEVDFDPRAWRQGRDSQLEKAVEILMGEIKYKPPLRLKRPPYPNYHKAKP